MRHLMGLMASLRHAPCAQQLRRKYFLLIWVNQKETLCRTLRTRWGAKQHPLYLGERDAQGGQWMALQQARGSLIVGDDDIEIL